MAVRRPIPDYSFPGEQFGVSAAVGSLLIEGIYSLVARCKHDALAIRRPDWSGACRIEGEASADAARIHQPDVPLAEA